MPKRFPLPTQERLKEVFEYDPETGVCTALTDRNTRRGPYKRGDALGYLDTFGYLKMTLDGKPFMMHRLIWKWMTGDEPPGHLDHVNQVKSDNRWANLREATVAQNLANRGVVRSNTSGRKGVTFTPSTGRWSASITIEGVADHLGHFATAEEAGAAYETRAKAHYGDFYDDSTGPQRVFYDVVQLCDEPFIETVAETMRRLWAYKLRPDVSDKVKAELDAIGVGLAQRLAAVEAKKHGHLRTS